ncbi:hypothetical protein K445DRAFT_14305 [Daldinia sp. EC12]|nr:hypothetical protein K445DRAFT_14305 [Daldinia sp. EC12]
MDLVQDQRGRNHSSNSTTISSGLNCTLPPLRPSNDLMHASNQLMESHSGPNASRAKTPKSELPSAQPRSECSLRMCPARAARILMCLKYSKAEEGAQMTTPHPEKETIVNPTENGSSHFEPPLSPSLSKKGSSGSSLVPVAHQKGSPNPQPAQCSRAHTATLEFAVSMVKMDRNVDREELPKPKRRNRSDMRSSVDKLMDEVDAVVGGEPAKDAPKEEWDRYLGAFINELDKRSESNAWPQLEKAERFVRRMGQAPFKRMNYSSEDDDPPRTGESTRPIQQKAQTEGSQNNGDGTLHTNGKSRKRRRDTAGVKKEEVRTASIEEQTAEKLELGDAEQSTGGNGTKSFSPDTPPPISSAEQSNSQRKKRRRTALEVLESNLGQLERDLRGPKYIRESDGEHGVYDGGQENVCALPSNYS